MKITLANIGKKFNRQWIFKDIDWEFKSNETVALVGNNGSGKSTLLQIIFNFQTYSKGSIKYELHGKVLSEEELDNLKVSKFQNMHGASPEGPGRVHRHIDSVEASQNRTVFDAETGVVEEPVKALSTQVNAREQVFEELYDLSRREIREYHNKLEAANYRLGQIETRLQHSVPLLDYQQETEALREKEEEVVDRMTRQTEALELLDQEVKSERLNKNIYIGLLFGLLALQPLLWLLLQG